MVGGLIRKREICGGLGLRSAIGTSTSTRTITIGACLKTKHSNRGAQNIDEQIEILLLTTDTGNRQLTGAGNCADGQQGFLEGLSLQRFAEVPVKSQIEESLFVPFERFCCQGEN
jgi:hypothetical protein